MKIRNKIHFAQLISTNLAHQTKEFFSNSTLHGIRYIAEKGRSIGEKLMWFCFVASGAVAALVIIDSLWDKFQTNPTITGLDTDFHNDELDFPSITVCPIEPYDPSTVNVTALQTFTSSDFDYEDYIPLLEMLPKLSYENMDMAYDVVLNASEKLDLDSQKNLRQLAFQVALSCDDLFYTCNFRGLKINCCEHFMPVYSERGFCYSFNSRYISTVEKEVKNDNILQFFETDKKWSLTFVLNNYASKIYQQSSHEIFSNDIRPQFLWEPGYSIDLLVSMKQTYTTDDAEQLTIGQRKCIFQGEVNLKILEHDAYSLTSCMIQCRIEMANKLCKCIPPFYQPATGNYRKCTLKDIKCLKDNRLKITNLKGCLNCELSCLNTVYESEKFVKTAIAKPKIGDSKVTIEFLTWPIIRYKREVLFGWVDLLVSFGGIAGLFLGFSLLSGMEVFYYFTIRASCMFVKNRQKLYEIKQENEARAKTRYDLSISPKFKRLKGDKQLSHSLPDIKTVKPVAGLEVPISSRASPDWNDGNFNKKRFQPTHMGEFKLIPRRQNIFSQIQFAPYSRKVKPLDRNFKLRSKSQGPSENIFFYGYLP